MPEFQRPRVWKRPAPLTASHRPSPKNPRSFQTKREPSSPWGSGSGPSPRLRCSGTRATKRSRRARSSRRSTSTWATTSTKLFWKFLWVHHDDSWCQSINKDLKIIRSVTMETLSVNIFLWYSQKMAIYFKSNLTLIFLDLFFGKIRATQKFECYISKRVILLSQFKSNCEQNCNMKSESEFLRLDNL